MGLGEKFKGESDTCFKEFSPEGGNITDDHAEGE